VAGVNDPQAKCVGPIASSGHTHRSGR